MKVFLSWSGQKSEQIAAALHEELPNFLQHVRPFFSVEDIKKGQLWQRILGEALEDIKFGIICVTPENVDQPWIHLEAGALSKLTAANRVVPLLFGLKPDDVRNPLTALFQATECEETDLRRLVHDLNEASPAENRLGRDRVNRAFDRCWPDLKRKLVAISPTYGRTELATGRLSVRQSAQSVRYIGRPFVNVITLTNEGTVAEDGVTLIAIPPPGISLTSVSDNGSIDGGRITWTINTLAAGASKSVQIHGTGNAVGVFSTFVAAFRAAAVSSAIMEVRGIDAIHLDVVDDPDPVRVGANTTYTITVTNQGSAAGTNIVISCTLPEQEEFVDAGGATAFTASNKSVTFAPLPSLAPKARATWTVTVKALAEGEVRFVTKMRTAEMRGDDLMETEATNIYQ